MNKKVSLLFGVLTSTTIALTGCTVEETAMFTEDNMAYTNEEIQMMVPGILTKHTKDPLLSANKNVKYRLSLDEGISEHNGMNERFAYKLSSKDGKLQSLAINYNDGRYNEVYNIDKLSKENLRQMNLQYDRYIKESNEVLDVVIAHMGNALNSEVHFKENGNIEVIYNVTDYVQEVKGVFDESVAFITVTVELNKEYELLSVKGVSVNEIGKETIYANYDVSDKKVKFK